VNTPERSDVIDAPSENGTADGASSQTSAAAGAHERTGVARRMDVVGLTAGFGSREVISKIDLEIEPRSVTALIGPSGAGKSTLLRCLNLMHNTAKSAFSSGEILLDGVDINARGVDPVLVRRRIGMVFQRPNPFPTMSIYDNVAAGLRLTSGARHGRHYFDEVVERSLRQADLWAEVKDRLHSMGGALSGGQQQRLCIARTLAVEPEVILMDEPCSALDPISTSKIEDSIHLLREHYTIVIVTHNMQQAARVSSTTAFMTVLEAGQPGTLVETGPTSDIFGAPVNEVTGAYVSGRFG
jgi:phosphate transport system ATP-binding protein